MLAGDTGWGLCVLLSIASVLERKLARRIPTDMMRMLVTWHQELMGKEYLRGRELTPLAFKELVLVETEADLAMVSGVI